MPAYKVAWLRKWALYGTIHQYARCAERSYKENVLVWRYTGALKKRNKRNTHKRTNKRPEVLFGINQCFAVNNIP